MAFDNPHAGVADSRPMPTAVNFDPFPPDKFGTTTADRIGVEACSTLIGGISVGAGELGRLGDLAWSRENNGTYEQYRIKLYNDRPMIQSAFGVFGGIAIDAALDHTVFSNLPMSQRTTGIDLFSPMIGIVPMNPWIKGAAIVGSHLVARALDARDNHRPLLKL